MPCPLERILSEETIRKDKNSGIRAVVSSPPDARRLGNVNRAIDRTDRLFDVIGVTPDVATLENRRRTLDGG